MSIAPKNTKANLIAWLRDTFGFQQHLVVPGENNSIVHAQLSFGNGMLMLGSARRVGDEAHGGRGFTCRDLEQHVWSFGTYDPFA